VQYIKTLYNFDRYDLAKSSRPMTLNGTGTKHDNRFWDLKRLALYSWIAVKNIDKAIRPNGTGILEVSHYLTHDISDGYGLKEETLPWEPNVVKKKPIMRLCIQCEFIPKAKWQ